MQKPKQLKDVSLKRLWRTTVRSSNSSSSSSAYCEAGLGDNHDDTEAEETRAIPHTSLPLLQVWPSQDSPRVDDAATANVDDTVFVFPDAHNFDDSGIESIRATPSPSNVHAGLPTREPRRCSSPSPSLFRQAATLLHPDHARLLLRQSSAPCSEQNSSNEDLSIGQASMAFSQSSSTASSLNSVAHAVHLHVDCHNERRRSSAMTARYSLFDALDLEYALLRAATRGSIGPCSITESIHKLTFTQSLAFPALARGLSGKRRKSTLSQSSRPLNANETGLNAFAKIITALVLVLVSVLVFLVVYKYVRT